MTRYVTPSEVLARYHRLTSVHSDTDLSSGYIPYAEAHVEGVLSKAYTPPFSNNNMTVKDLCIDLTLLKAGTFKGDEHKQLMEMVSNRFKDLCDGNEVMVTDAGVAIVPTQAADAYHTHQDYEPVFHMGDVLDTVVDPDLIDDEITRRS